MKKILHITSQYPGKTGSGIYLQALISEGKKKGYIQGLISGISNRDIISYTNTDKFYPVIFNTEEIPFSIVGMSDIMPYESTKYCDLTKDMLDKWKEAFIKVITNAIEDLKPDIIISHHLWLSTSLVRQIAKDIKVIGICHGTDIRQFEKCIQYRKEVLEGCEKLDLILSLSEEQRQVISKVYNVSKDKVIVIGGGYKDNIFFSPLNKVNSEKIKIIYAGKLSYAKGVVSLLKAFKNIREKYNTKLTLVGLGTGKEEKHIKELGFKLGEDVDFLGELSQEDLGRVFRESDIFVLPSLYEGLSLVTIEALASGLLIVVTEIPGLKSTLGDYINNSRVIEYVKLPKMINVDKPLKEELPLFEYRLQIAIEKQIGRIYEDYTIDNRIKEEIKKMSWQNIFNKIEKHF